ncbi:hypothetical protein ScPMuIL_004560 [Solemya velum]
MDSATHHPSIDNKELEFEVDIQDAQFNLEGRYFLKLSIHSLFTTDYSRIQLRRGPGAEFLYDNEAITDIIQQKETQTLVKFQDHHFTFRLPKGFCKNDKNHDVYMLVEAYTLPQNRDGMGRKVGEGKCAIYPRPNAPRIKVNVEPGEDYFHHKDDSSCQSTVKPIRKPVTPEASPKLRTPSPAITQREKQQATPASSWGDNVSFNLPPSPPPPPLTDNGAVKPSPLPDHDHHTFQVGRSYRHVADKGNEQIDVIVHGAISLPSAADGKVPRPYVAVSTNGSGENSDTAGVTHAVLRPTYSPSWEEMVALGLDGKKASNEELLLSVGNAEDKLSLVNYRLPLAYLTPFHQYHLEMVKSAPGVQRGVRLFASITRKLARLPRDASSPNYLALEVLLRSVQKPVKNPRGPLIAVARIVPDYHNYKTDQLVSHPKTAGVTMTSITFPSPHPVSFSVPQQSSHGYPQLSLPGRPDQQPTWNHPYLFCEERDKATLFVPRAALVIEYYVANTAMTDQFWKMHSPVGYSVLQMDQDMYSTLIKESARHGLRVEGLPIQGTDMLTHEGRRPTVGLILRLITTNQPDSMVEVSNFEDLPVMDMYPVNTISYYRTTSPDILHLEPDNQSQIPLGDDISYIIPDTPKSPQAPAYYLQLKRKRPMSPIKDGEMPSLNAVESVLPDYQYIFSDPDGQRSPDMKSLRHHRPVEIRTRPTDELDKTSTNLLEHQLNELEHYRTAVHKMGQDILTLRQQIRELESNNSQLRRDLANYNDASRLMIDSSELDGLSKPEIMSRYAALKQTLNSQTNDIRAYKEKVQKLQNDLIKKNDDEKNYLRRSQAQMHQQELLQKYQDRVKKVRSLEEACKQQEKVIERMEKIIEKKQKDRGKSRGDNSSQEANEALLAENRRLRQQIDDLKGQESLGKAGASETEKLDLYQSLERAEGRIMSLEKQLAENSRQWGKERADMKIRLSEAENGLGRSTGMVLHDYPAFNEKFNSRHLSPLYR